MRTSDSGAHERNAKVGHLKRNPETLLWAGDLHALQLIRAYDAGSVTGLRALSPIRDEAPGCPRVSADA